MKNEQVIIAIPIYKNTFSVTESISMRQAVNIFGEYEICFITYKDLQLTEWCNIKRRYFEKKYFESTSTYNELMLSNKFYEEFTEFEYVLIYQLDCFVFRDDLLYFCNKGYDYIGAPWLHGQAAEVNGKMKVAYVGNGGLSLRKVKSCIELLQSEQDHVAQYSRNEDFFYSVKRKNFKVAPISLALQFAFETQVEKCYRYNRYRLPFGCHAWERYNLNFWYQYIIKSGHELSRDAITTGNEDFINKEKYRKDRFFHIKLRIKGLIYRILNCKKSNRI